MKNKFKKNKVRKMECGNLEIENNKDINLEIEYINPKYFEKFFYYDDKGNIVEKINFKMFKIN